MPLADDYLNADPTYLNAQRLRAHVGNPLEVSSPWDGSLWTVIKLGIGATLMAGAWIGALGLVCLALAIVRGAL